MTEAYCMDCVEYMKSMPDNMRLLNGMPITTTLQKTGCG